MYMVSQDAWDFSLDPFAGGTYRGKPILPLESDDGDSVVDHLVRGTMIDTGDANVITYGFFDHVHAVGQNNSPHFGEGAGYSPLTELQRDAARDAVALWDDLVSARFVEVGTGAGASGWAQNDADIWLANTTTGPAQAWAYYPSGSDSPSSRIPSDAWIADPRINPSNNDFKYGEYGNTTIIHELGHSLGLSHPGAYNGTGTFADDAEYAQDTYQYSIMSYFNGTNSGQIALNWNLGGVAAFGAQNPETGTYPFNFYANYPQGPQLHDIVAIQSIYGADPTTRVDATTYGFNSNAGNELYDFNANPNPMYSIYDAGGNDTIDASGFDVSQFIDLHDGAFSSIGGGVPSADDVNAYWTEYYAGYGLEFPAGFFTDAALATKELVAQIGMEYRIERDTGVKDIYATQFDNVSIAYNTVIENATGGSARDLLWGNEVANDLKGMGGNDVLNGYQGADTLWGGAGNDTFQFSHLEAGDQIADWNAGDIIDISKIDADSATAGNQGFAYIGDGAFTVGVAGQLRYANGVVEGDTNGDGVADISFSVTGNPALNGATDFLL